MSDFLSRREEIERELATALDFDRLADCQTLWIPVRPPTLNDLIDAKGTVFRGKGPKRGDRYQAIKKAWLHTVAYAARIARIRPVERCRIAYELVEANRRRDPDNVAGAVAKLCSDGLVECGILPGDGWKTVLGISFTWRVGKTPGVMIRIEEVE